MCCLISVLPTHTLNFLWTWALLEGLKCIVSGPICLGSHFWIIKNFTVVHFHHSSNTKPTPECWVKYYRSRKSLKKYHIFYVAFTSSEVSVSLTCRFYPRNKGRGEDITLFFLFYLFHRQKEKIHKCNKVMGKVLVCNMANNKHYATEDPVTKSSAS